MSAVSQSLLRERVGDPDLAARLKRNLRGEVLFDATVEADTAPMHPFTRLNQLEWWYLGTKKILNL